jgi:putative alpha-1,2-mannosidase
MFKAKLIEIIMKIQFKLFYILLVALIACTPEKESTQTDLNFAQFVDPFICTADDHGQTDVAAAVPFGMVKPCPDTYPIGHSGYEYNSNEILGFSHTRFSGVGCTGVGGNIRVLPFANSDTIPYKIAYDKSTEIAEAGYYAVTLNKEIQVELTATNRVAFHRYTFPESEKSGLSVDLSSSFAGHVSQEHQLDDEGILCGKVESLSVCQRGKYSVYFAFYVDKKDVQINSKGSQVIYRFSTKKQEEIKAYCALSVVSAEQAKTTLKEKMNFQFDEIRNEAWKQWNNLLSTVEVQTKDTSALRLFYTHLYHTTQSPFLISEEDGTYRGSDGKIYKNTLDTYFHGWSVWDTFRSKLPLFSFLFPEKYKSMMASLAELYKQGKPAWATQTEPFITVRTEHSLAVLLDAHRKGLLTFSLDEIYPYLQAEADSLPFKSPDNVLESSYDLWALSEIAKDLGYNEDAKKYFAKAMNYQTTWKKLFLRMGETADIMHGDGLYEGTLWQYRWFVPFDIAGIQELVGGKDVFEQQLDYFFENELFNIGNQPDIQVPYLYAYTNSPWKTQEIVHRLMNTVSNSWYGTHEKWDKPYTRRIFQDSPEGYIKEMDDDAGTMSAWYVWSAMGFFPVFPGSTEMVITTPQFDKIDIKVSGGVLGIETIRPSKNAIYIKKIEIDGEVYNSCFIDFKQLTKGGKIRIELDEQPKI